MKRWVIVWGVLAACGKTESKPQPEPDWVSEGEAEARKVREEFRKVIADFRDDLAANRLDAAYERIAPMTQASFAKQALAQLATHPALAPGVEYRTGRTSVSNGLAKVQGQLTGPSGPASYELRCTYVKGWRISGLAIDGTSILPPR